MSECTGVTNVGCTAGLAAANRGEQNGAPQALGEVRRDRCEEAYVALVEERSTGFPHQHDPAPRSGIAHERSPQFVGKPVWAAKLPLARLRSSFPPVAWLRLAADDLWRARSVNLLKSGSRCSISARRGVASSGRPF